MTCDDIREILSAYHDGELDEPAAGLLRATIWSRYVGSLWPSLAMLGVCLAAAALFQPYWIGALGGYCCHRCRTPQAHDADYLGR